MENSRKLKLGSCVTILIGAMFGSAIFSLSGLTIFEAGPAVLISWIAAAPIMLIYGLITAELASYFPKSGGVYVFPARAMQGKHGQFWGWISCWGFILGNFAAIAFSAIYVGVYLGVAFTDVSNFQIPIALISLLVCLIVNVVNLKTTGKVNSVLVICLLVIMAVFIGTTITNQSFDLANFVPFFGRGNSGDFGFISMVPTAILSYSSIVTIAFMASEIEKPHRAIPMSCIIAIVFIAIFYALIIFSTLGVVSCEFLEQNPDLTMIPIFAACSKLANAEWLTPLISIASVLALITTMLVMVTINARAIQAAAEDKILPRQLAYTAKNGQPINSVIVCVIISAIITLFPNYVSEIINFGILFNLITIFIVVISLFMARKSCDVMKDGFKLPSGKVLPIIFLVILFGCGVVNVVTSNSMMIFIYTIMLLAIGVIIFLLTDHQK